MIELAALIRSAGFAGDGIDLSIRPDPAAARGTTLRSLVEQPAALTEAVDGYADYHLESFGPSARRDISALWLLQDISWLHAVLLVGLLPRHGISIEMDADALAMTFPRDMYFTVELAESAVRVRTVTSAAERRAQYARARKLLSELFTPLHEPLRAELRAGSRAYWACVTDMATGALNTGSSSLGTAVLQTSLGEFAAAAHEDRTIDRLLGPTPLVASPTGPMRRRHGCCLLYAIDGMGLCLSCPRVPAPA